MELNTFAVNSNNLYSMNEDQLHRLLTKVNEVCLVAEQERRAKESRGECYNVFNVLGLWSEEVRLHSAFIAELLNPKGSHGLEGAFLKAFLKQVNLSEDYIDVGKCNQNIVERKIGEISDAGTEGGRIDIIIEDGLHALIIENKIYAGDQYNQLLRYSNYAKEKFRDKFEIIYLTLDGHEADEGSTNKEVTYKCMSYREDVIEWLTECAKLAFAHPLVRETIIQYIQLVKQLTNLTMDENHIKEVAEIAVKNKDSMFSLFDAKYEIGKILREEYIFEPLKEYAKTKGLAFELGEYSFRFSKIERDEGCIEIISDSSRHSWTKMYVRIISNNEEGKTTSLCCLKVPGSVDYPYGWQWVNIQNWESTESFRAIMNRDVAKWIMEKVDQILKEIEDRGITL